MKDSIWARALALVAAPISDLHWRKSVGFAVCVAIAERVAWSIRGGMTATSAVGEMHNVAVAFATQGQLADAYHINQGPTAHVMPLTPLIAGTIYRHLGIDSFAAEFVLLCWATFLAIGSYLVAYKLFRALGSPLAACRVALLTLLVVPFFLSMEASWFRIWEGSLAALLAAIFLYLLVTFEAAGSFSYRSTLLVSLSAAVLLFVSPPLGVPAYLCALLSMLRTQPWRVWPRTAVIAVVALSAVLSGWVIRNERVFGQFIPLRSNFGIEYAIGLNPNSSGWVDKRTEFNSRINIIHPMHSESAYNRMLHYGEYGYSKQLTAETSEFLRENPGDAARLLIRNAFGFYFPPPWMWGKAGADSNMLQAVVHYVVSVFGLIGALAALFRSARWRYIAFMVFGPALTYALAHPQIRYNYIIFALQFYAAADLLYRVAKSIYDRSNRAVVPSTISLSGGNLK